MPHAASKPPVFSALNDDECLAILRRNHVGRIAFLNRRVADIVPVHYAASGEWIYLRSADGAKVEAFGHNPFVALEVDEVKSPSEWCSVVAHGTIYFMSDDGTEVRRKAYEKAVAALREIAPHTLTEEDTTPYRQIIYGIHIDSCTGRMASEHVAPDRTALPHPPSKRRAPRTSDGS